MEGAATGTSRTLEAIEEWCHAASLKHGLSYIVEDMGRDWRVTFGKGDWRQMTHIGKGALEVSRDFRRDVFFELQNAKDLLLEALLRMQDPPTGGRWKTAKVRDGI